MIIYLLGFMGSGKTTVGKKLAGRFSIGFTDLDLAIEESDGRSVETIFSEKGEEYFRNIESEVLKQVSVPGDKVIACGGGTPCYFDNMDFMKRHGITVYLKMTPQALFDRLRNSRHQRPLVAGRSGGDLLSYIETKLSERETWYKQSSIIIDGLNVNLKLLEEAVRRL